MDKIFKYLLSFLCVFSGILSMDSREKIPDPQYLMYQYAQYMRDNNSNGQFLQDFAKENYQGGNRQFENDMNKWRQEQKIIELSHNVLDLRKKRQLLEQQMEKQFLEENDQNSKSNEESTKVQTISERNLKIINSGDWEIIEEKKASTPKGPASGNYSIFSKAREFYKGFFKK